MNSKNIDEIYDIIELQIQDREPLIKCYGESVDLANDDENKLLLLLIVNNDYMPDIEQI